VSGVRIDNSEISAGQNLNTDPPSAEHLKPLTITLNLEDDLNNKKAN
jgi:hypothetical protein